MFNIAALFWGKKKTRKHKRRKHHHHRSRRAHSRTASIEQFVVEEIVLDNASVPKAPPLVEVKKKPNRDRWVSIRITASYCGLWLLLIAAALLARSIWPPEETQLLAAAWEMWAHGDWLVPKLNGDAFLQQPPLALWWIGAGWSILGVNDWWPRLMPALFALASLILIGRSARLLWSGSVEIARYAPIVLLASLYWAFSSTLLLTDMLRGFFVWLTLLGFLHIGLAGDRHAWWWTGLSFGLAILAGGLLSAVFILPVALLAPLWVSREIRHKPKRGYADILKAVCLGAVVFMVWAVPVIFRGGPASIGALASGLLMDQGGSYFSLQQPWWWYAALLPVVLLPWSFLPLVWIRLWHIRADKINSGIVFCLIAAVPAVLLLSLFEIKEPQLLLPVVPAFALIVSYLLFDDDLIAHRQDGIGASMILPVILLGALLAILPGLPRVDYLPGMLWELSPFVGITISLTGIALAWLPSKKFKQRIIDVAVTSVFLLVVANFAFGLQFGKTNQLQPIAQVLADAQSAGRPVAYVGHYAGDYHYAGRLMSPLQVLDPEEVPAWSLSNPDGLIVSKSRDWQPDSRTVGVPFFESPQLGHVLRIWEARAIVAGLS